MNRRKFIINTSLGAAGIGIFGPKILYANNTQNKDITQKQGIVEDIHALLVAPTPYDLNTLMYETFTIDEKIQQLNLDTRFPNLIDKLTKEQLRLEITGDLYTDEFEDPDVTEHPLGVLDVTLHQGEMDAILKIGGHYKVIDSDAATEAQNFYVAMTGATPIITDGRVNLKYSNVWDNLKPNHKIFVDNLKGQRVGIFNFSDIGTLDKKLSSGTYFMTPEFCPGYKKLTVRK